MSVHHSLLALWFVIIASIQMACVPLAEADGATACPPGETCSSSDAGIRVEDAGHSLSHGDGGSNSKPWADAGQDINDAGHGDSGAQWDAGEQGPDQSDAGQTHADAGTTDSSPIDGGSTDSGTTLSCNDCWRSVLYPEDWEPDYTDVSGRFLHDFSYAGVENGEGSIPPTLTLSTFSVLDYGADPTGNADSTDAAQAAISAAANAGGGIIYFPAGEYRMEDVLTITSSHIVLRGDGPTATQIFFTRHLNMTDQAHIRYAGQVQESTESLLVQNGESRSLHIAIEDASHLQIGDEVHVGWVITDAFIDEHNMSGTWQVSNGQWRPFFRRHVTGVDISSDPHLVHLDVPLRYQAKTRDSASARVSTGYLERCGVESMAVSNAVDMDNAWENDRAHVIEMDMVKDCWVWNVESYATPNGGGDGHYQLQSGGIKINRSKRVTVADSVMENAQHRGSGGNGYLFEVSQSNEVLFRDLIARNGRHNFIQNWDFGTTGCVFLRTRSEGGRVLAGSWDPIGTVGYSEFHHSLAMANLIDDSYASDGWSGVNRHDWSSGAGLTVTETVFWRLRGGGTLYTFQAGMGYAIGTDDMTVVSDLDFFDPFSQRAEGSEPADFTEGIGVGSTLTPTSLYEDQLLRRLQQ